MVMNLFNRLSIIFLSAAVLTACPKVDPDDPNPDPLRPEQIQEKLENTANDLMNQYPARKFEKLTNLATRFSEEFIENDNYDWDDVIDYCDDKGESIFTEDLNTRYEGNNTYYDWYTAYIIELSDLNGKITLGSYSASCVDYDGTQVAFSLDGKNYVAKLTPSGKTTTAIYDYEDIYGREDIYGDEYYHYDDKYHFEIEVPEKITVKITENGQDFAEITLYFYVSFSKDGVSVTKDSFAVTASVKIDGHEIVIERTGYNASTGKASLSYTLKKDGDEILHAEASADAKFHLVTEEDEGPSGYDDYIYPEFTIAKNVDLYVNVLDEVQIKGTCSNVLNLVEYIDTFYESSNESSLERAVDNINNILDLGIYLNGEKTKQVDIVMDYYIEDAYDWYLEPIIVFSDGSKYAFYEYFTESRFNDTVNSFDEWMEEWGDFD